IQRPRVVERHVAEVRVARAAADSNRSISGDGTGSFNNGGTLNSVASSRGSTGDTNFSNVAFNNTGTLNVFSGQIFLNTSNNLAPDQTLSQGTWNVFDGATLSFGDSVFTTLAAEVNISGAEATFSGISLLNRVEEEGRFGIFNGQNFVAGTGPAFSNAGEIEVGAGSRFDAANNPLGNLDGDAIFGGRFIIEGTFLTGADQIRLLEADLTLRGTESVFSGIEGLEQVGSSGRLELAGGRNFATAGDFDVSDGGLVRIGDGSTFQITGELVNNGASGVFDAAAFDVGGTLIASNLNIVEISNELILDGAGSQVLDGQGNDAIAGLQRIREDGILRLRNGRSLDNIDNLDVQGILSIEGDPVPGIGRGAPAGTVEVNGTTLFGSRSTLEIILNGSEDSLYGQLFSGTVEVEEGATLSLVVDPAAAIGLGDEFALVQAGDMNGIFTTILGLEFGDGLSFEVSQDASGVFARVVPAPGFGLVLVAAGVAASRRRR
ncbi:MAG: hypothetical protein AAGA55_09890, partial [Planctomycetota bacterium]